MEIEARPICEEFGFHLDVLDIDADPMLAARFDELVPVLMHGETELARYRLKVPEMRAYLAGIR